VTQKLEQILNIWPDQIQILCPSLRIHGQLPAPIVNGGGDSCWKWSDFQLSRTRDLDLESGHTAYHRTSVIDLYLHSKFHWNRRTFCGRTDVRTDGHLRPTLLGRLKRVDLNIHCQCVQPPLSYFHPDALNNAYWTSSTWWRSTDDKPVSAPTGSWHFGSCTWHLYDCRWWTVAVWLSNMRLDNTRQNPTHLTNTLILTLTDYTQNFNAYADSETFPNSILLQIMLQFISHNPITTPTSLISTNCAYLRVPARRKQRPFLHESSDGSIKDKVSKWLWSVPSML